MTVSRIKGCFAAGDFVEEWHNLKWWYHIADSRKGRVVHSSPPLGWSMPINVTPIPVSDGTPTDPEIREVVAKLWNGCTVGMMGMQAEHLKEWLHSIRHEEAEDGVEGAGDCWRLFVSLIQAIWENGTMPTQMSWMVIVFLPKGGGEITMVLVYSTTCGKL